MLLSTIYITEGTGDGLEECLSVCHIVIAEEGAVACHVGECHDRAVFCYGVEFLCHLYHLVEGDGRDVECLVEEAVVEVVVGALLTHVDRHSA